MFSLISVLTFRCSSFVGVGPCLHRAVVDRVVDLVLTAPHDDVQWFGRTYLSLLVEWVVREPAEEVGSVPRRDLRHSLFDNCGWEVAAVEPA